MVEGLKEYFKSGKAAYEAIGKKIGFATLVWKGRVHPRMNHKRLTLFPKP